MSSIGLNEFMKKARFLLDFIAEIKHRFEKQRKKISITEQKCILQLESCEAGLFVLLFELPEKYSIKSAESKSQKEIVCLSIQLCHVLDCT